MGGGAWRWLTAREAVPAHSDYTIDLSELRALADSLPGPGPESIHSALVADTSLPRAAVFAGEAFTPQPFVHQVFQLLWADGSFVLIDAAFPHERLSSMGGGEFHEAAFQAVRKALGAARKIVLTHEHSDHLAGVASAEAPDSLSGRLLLTPEQLGNKKALDDSGIPEALRQALTPFVYARTVALAPGVVLQKAPGHTPGSQLVYVKTADGRETLFIGDVAWQLDQITKLHYRPRLVTDFFLGEDRKAVLDQFRALHELMSENPMLQVVVSHDRDQRERLLAGGELVDGLAQP
jgi:glyoxylase-like metal-dependent hydrolase (beta-lactamase superfamily II)